MQNLAVAWRFSPREPDPPRADPSQLQGGASRLPGKITILVVDDEPYVRRLTARMLRDFGYDVLEAGNAAEALATLEGRLHVELVLTDIAMPGMDGVRLADTIAQQHPGHRVMLMSGFAAVIRKLGLDGAQLPILRKPFSAADLARAVRTALGSTDRLA